MQSKRKSTESKVMVKGKSKDGQRKSTCFGTWQMLSGFVKASAGSRSDFMQRFGNGRFGNGRFGLRLRHWPGLGRFGNGRFQSVTVQTVTSVVTL
jgi:hypothetical protein